MSPVMYQTYNLPAEGAIDRAAIAEGRDPAVAATGEARGIGKKDMTYEN